MGANRRYAESLQRRRLNRIAEAEAIVPRSLSEAERGSPVRRGEPVLVQAWVPIGDVNVRVFATATEWSDRAVHIHWTGLGDDRRDCWVWAAACERLAE